MILFEAHEDPVREAIIFYGWEAEILRGDGLGCGPLSRNEEPRPRPRLLNTTFCFVVAVFHQTKSLFIMVLAKDID